MWKNFRLQSTIQQIGKVVAPPIDDDEEEDYYEEEDDDDEHDGYEHDNVADPNNNGDPNNNESIVPPPLPPPPRVPRRSLKQAYELEEDDDIISQEDDFYYTMQDHNSSPVSRPNHPRNGPFGFVNMLTRAMDVEQKHYDDSINDEDEEGEASEFLQSRNPQKEISAIESPTPSLPVVVVDAEPSEHSLRPEELEEEEEEPSPPPLVRALVRESGTLTPLQLHKSDSNLLFATQALLPKGNGTPDRAKSFPNRRAWEGLVEDETDSPSATPQTQQSQVEYVAVSPNPDARPFLPEESSSATATPPEPLTVNGEQPHVHVELPKRVSRFQPPPPPLKPPASPVPSASPPRPHVAAVQVEHLWKAPPSPPALKHSIVPTTHPQSQGDASVNNDLETNAAKLERQCNELQAQLELSQQEIATLRQQEANHHHHRSPINNNHGSDVERLMQQFQEKEARILQASAEEHANEMILLRGEMDRQFEALQTEMERDRVSFAVEREQLERLVQEANARADRAERQSQVEHSQQQNELMLAQKQQEREMRRNAEKLAQTMAMLDERDEQIRKLKNTLQQMKSRVTEHQAGAREAESEMDELHTENDELRHHVEELEAQCAQLQARLDELQSDSEKLSGLKMELRMLKEERERERARIESAAAAAEGTTAQLEEVRNRAMAEVQDLRRQLAAAVADLGVARTDTERIMEGRNNLQAALEAFQSEREAELAMLEEQRMEEELATAAAHAASIDAINEAHEVRIREVQMAADAAMRNLMEELKALETKLEKYRNDNIQMRRSLDEAIHRLQSTQEDVIDRTLMKNILMDWLTKTGVKERRQVLGLMASVLHFTDEEKERVHIEAPSGPFGNIVHTVAAPLPPTKADLEHLEGDNIRDKFRNFLLAETED